jgi:hypothetical protein
MLKITKSSHGAEIDQLQNELLSAVRVSEDEIEATACNPQLYDRVRLRIAAERDRRDVVTSLGRRRLTDLFPSVLGPARSTSWILTAASVVLIVAAGLLFWMSRQSQVVDPQDQAKQSTPPQVVQSAPKDEATQQPPKERVAPLVKQRDATPEIATVSAPKPIKKRSRSIVPADEGSGEIATDFIPLTFTADVTAPESGHLVRVRMPRSALVAMGLPMNAERASEFVRADVFYGDDGLARAIRFIQ